MADSIRIKNLIDGEWLFTQNKVSTIRVAAPVGQLAADAVPDKPAEIPASKGDVRSCIAS